MRGRLNGKVAVVTGAASGLGAATARLFHAEGARVVLGDVSGGQKEVADELGDGAVAVHVDVTQRAEVENLIRTATDTFGRLDCVINVAGIDGPLAPAATISEEEFRKVFEVNVVGPLHVMQTALPQLVDAGGGAIVNVASSSAVKAFPMMGAYTASKSALIALSRAFAVENIGYGVRVNVVNPGAMDTPMARALPPEMFEGATAATPIQRPADPAEVAEGILFLASDAASFAVASVVTLDGGMAAS